MKLLKEKKGIELSLQTIVVLIISLVVFIVIVYFFANNYIDGSSGVTNMSTNIINDVRK
ncbi:MAG: hypothetical protein PF569_04615 [Candidatus Woesearchaeota archaeon]|jgi:hypothetical protein|nr:hypothetical protein [Candidatus Woesearchaeota archaeon]